MSKYKWDELISLNDRSKAWNSQLSCIAHIDMNAFYSQVDQVRYGFSKDDPVVSVQWSSIIAVSYAARKYGISRMDTLESARAKCKNLKAVHTATFKKGENFWKSTPLGEFPSPFDHKVSLDPYRREGRKILSILQSHCDLVQKASVDEAFLDLGRIVYDVILGKSSFLELSNEQNNMLQEVRDLFSGEHFSRDDNLPEINKKVNEHFKPIGNIIKEKNSEESPTISDWDELIIVIGSMITDKIRADIFAKTSYFTSCGVSNNKSLSKIASDFKKPDTQTIIFNKSIDAFLDNGHFEVTDFWTLGGNKGKEVMDILECPKFDNHSNQYIRETWANVESLSARMKERYADLSIFQKFTFNIKDCDALSEKIYKLVRGMWKEPINPRPLVKSMMANKNMRGEACKNLEDCQSWLKVFAAELEMRISELQDEYNKILVPKTISVALRSENRSTVHSKSRPFIINSTDMSKEQFYELIYNSAVVLMKELDSVYKDVVYPLSGLMLTLSNFEIIGKGSTIVDMFKAPKKKGHDDEMIKLEPVVKITKKQPELKFFTKRKDDDPVKQSENKCSECNLRFHQTGAYIEHMDYHYALSLSKKLNGESDEFEKLKKQSKKKTNKPGIASFFKKKD